MNKTEFLDKLDKSLKRIPDKDKKDAVAYYSEYIDDAENQFEVIERLGSPSKVGAQVMASFYADDEDIDTTFKKGISSAKAIVLSVLAAPLGIPLAIAALLLVFAFFLVIVALLFSIYAIGVSLAVSGVVALVAGIMTIISSVPISLMVIGSSFVLLSCGVVVFILAASITMFIVNTFSNFAKKITKKDVQYE